MNVWSTWRCSLVGDLSIYVLRDCSVTDGHHGHELLDDGSCRLQDAKREVWLLKCAFVCVWLEGFFCFFYLLKAMTWSPVKRQRALQFTVERNLLGWQNELQQLKEVWTKTSLTKQLQLSIFCSVQCYALVLQSLKHNNINLEMMTTGETVGWWLTCTNACNICPICNIYLYIIWY